jgi:hypothetical protein
VLVNGEGQVKHTAALQGRIVAEKFTPEFDYIAGDATPTYGGRLTRALRCVVFVKGEAPLVVLYDDLVAKEPSTFQFMLHALKAFAVNEQAAQLSVAQPRAGVVAKYLSPVPLKFRQWDGFQPPPTKEFPNQWHVEAGTQDKRKDLGMLTVLVPYRTGQRSDWAAERLESDTAIGVRIVMAGKPTLIAFRKEGVAGEASLAGLKFDGSSTVQQATR